MVQFEQKKMEETIETLKEQKEELVKENKKLSAENFFFHQSTTIFINLKKVMEMEKSYYYQRMEIQLREKAKLAKNP